MNDETERELDNEFDIQNPRMEEHRKKLFEKGKSYNEIRRLQRILFNIIKKYNFFAINLRHFGATREAKNVKIRIIAGINNQKDTTCIFNDRTFRPNDRGCVIFPKTATEFENIKSLFKNNEELAEFVKDGPEMTNETLIEDISITPGNEKSEQATPQSKMKGFYIPIESPFIELLGYPVLFPTGGRSKKDIKKQKNRQLDKEHVEKKWFAKKTKNKKDSNQSMSDEESDEDSMKTINSTKHKLDGSNTLKKMFLVKHTKNTKQKNHYSNFKAKVDKFCIKNIIIVREYS